MKVQESEDKGSKESEESAVMATVCEVWSVV